MINMFIEFSKENKKLLEDACEKIKKDKSEDYDIDLCIEEMAELTQALFKLRRYRDIASGEELTWIKSHISEEIADVLITLNKVIILHDNEKEIEEFINLKMRRVEEWLDTK